MSYAVGRSHSHKDNLQYGVYSEIHRSMGSRWRSEPQGKEDPKTTVEEVKWSEVTSPVDVLLIA